MTGLIRNFHQKERESKIKIKEKKLYRQLKESF